MTTKLDQIYLDNLAVDEDDVIDIEALQEKARASVQPSLFDLGSVNSMGYGIPPVHTLMSKEDKKFAGQIVQSVGKGVVMEVGGLAGDLLGIVKGLYNIHQDQMDQLMEKIKNPEAEQEVISKFDSFIKGFDDIKALNLPPLLGRTSEAIGEDLTEMGFDPKSEADSELKKKILTGAELTGQVATPGVGATPLIKGGKKIVETVKDLNPKSVKILNNGVKQIFKSNRPDTFGNRFTYQKNKVFTDKEGKPIVFYHGTNNPKLKTGKLDIPNQRRELMYFTTLNGLAESFTKNATTHPDFFNRNVKVTKKMEKDYKKTLRPRLIEANLKMEKPFIVKGSKKGDQDGTNFTVNMNETLTIISNNIKRKLGDYTNINWEDISRSSNYKVHPRTIKLLKDKGYDGIIFPAIDIYLPFFDDAVQIKKVIKGKINE